MSDTEAIQILLFESLNREKELTRLLNDQMVKNDSLQLQIEIERRKTEFGVEFTSTTDGSENNIQIQNGEISDLKNTYGTNSSVLMEYKYDELRQCHSKCVKKLCKKSKQLKKVLHEAELLKFKNSQLANEITELNKKIEQICFCFFGLLDRRSEEQIKLKIRINQLVDLLEAVRTF